MLLKLTGAVAATVPTLTPRLPLSEIEAPLHEPEKLLHCVVVAVAEVAFRTVFDERLTEALPKSVVALTVTLEALSTVAFTNVDVNGSPAAVKATVPVVSMMPVLTPVPESDTAPEPAEIPLANTEELVLVRDTAPPPLVIVPVPTDDAAFMVTLPPPDVTLDVLTELPPEPSVTAPVVVMSPVSMKPGAVAKRLPPLTLLRSRKLPGVTLPAIAETAPVPALSESEDPAIDSVVARLIAPPAVAIVGALKLWIRGALNETAPPAVVMFAPISIMFEIVTGPN